VLDGKTIQQAPERFIEEHLIKPVTAVLGYEYRPQPKGVPGIEEEIPDFSVKNTDRTIIGELKKPNKIEDGRREAFEYLQKTTARPVVGISTDGITWILHSAKDEDTSPKYTYHQSFRDELRTLRAEYKYGSSIESAHEFRSELAQFVDKFKITNLNKRMEI
jgi:hypothetical protein